MLDLLKNKVMIGFILLVLLVVYFDSVNVKRMEEMDNDVGKSQITINNK